MKAVTPAEINMLRGVVVWVLRALATVLLAIGLYLVLKRVLFGLATGQLELIYNVWEGIGEGNSFYRGLAALMVGLAIAIGSERVSKWIIAVPPESCPRCGYEQPRPAGTAVCPECGLCATVDPQARDETR